MLHGAEYVQEFDVIVECAYPGRKVAVLPWRADDGLDSVEVRLGHLMRRGNQRWDDLMALSFHGLCACYAALTCYVRAENKAGGGDLD